MSLESIRARTAKRRTEGADQTHRRAGVHPRPKPKAKKPLAILPCEHEGAVLEWCQSCPATSEGRHVRECDVHGKCTREYVSGKVRACATCADHTGRPRATPDVAPEPTPDVAAVRAAFVAEFRAELERVRSLPYPDGRYSGAGVVIPAGGWKMLPGVWVTVQMLRSEAVNSRLPIEVWYVGDEGEYDPIFSDITAGMGVTWRDISAELRRLGIPRTERLWGWAAKPLALLLSSFERVVMLDSDCYPVYDPERLWSDPRIESKPAAFWSDNPQNKWGRPLTADQWAAFGLAPVPTPGFESGQMLVDKRRSWAACILAAWLSDRMDYFDATRADRGRVRIHGDKELFSVAWNATGTAYHMAPPVRYHEVAFLQHDPDGNVCFVHRCNDKPRIGFAEWKLTHQRQQGPDASLNFRSTTLPHDHMVHRFLGELRETLRPSLPGFRDGTQDEQIWREVRIANVYRLPKRMDGMRVIDVGAHAGFFAHECCRRGASMVIAVEPWPANLPLARMNLALWTARCQLVEAALAEPGVEYVTMRPGRGAELTGEPHVGPDGVRLAAVSLDELIEQCGTVDLLKIDAEGAEYPALLTARRLGQVRRIAGEFHTHVPAHRPCELRASLEAAGFVVEMDESAPIGMFHATRGANGPDAAEPHL